jgi:hypothetical protein
VPRFGVAQADVGLAEDRTAAFATEVPATSGHGWQMPLTKNFIRLAEDFRRFS